MATANHVLLQRTTLTADVATVTLSGIPTTGYTDLKLVMSARTTYAGAQSDYVIVKFNNTTTTYTGRLLIGTGTSVSSISPNGWRWFAEVNSNGQTAKTFGNAEIYIPNYSVVGVTKPYSSNSVSESNAATTEMEIFAGLWDGTAAINSIEMASGNSGNFMAGSSFSLYGIADAATIPAAAPKADGGDIIKTDGTYWYHTFTSAGVFKPQLNLTCDYLVVGGGGGGGATESGNGGAGGGGAGGFRTGTGLSVTSNTSYNVLVGAGGLGSTSRVAAGTSGTGSTFSTITSAGGGYGASAGGIAPASGGSGGGGTMDSRPGGAGNTPSTSPSQGNNGGTMSPNSPYVGAGGGGATAAGGVGGSTGGTGTGGAGTASSITGTSVTYAGGGGGGAGNNGSGASNGGAGGGGNGGTGTASAGTAATGGGGGGGGGGTTPAYGGNGGSGVVIIRYLVA